MYLKSMPQNPQGRPRTPSTSSIQLGCVFISQVSNLEKNGKSSLKLRLLHTQILRWLFWLAVILGVKSEEGSSEIKFWHFFSLIFFQFFGCRCCADVDNILYSILFYNDLHFKIIKYTAAVADKTNTCTLYVGLNLAFLRVAVSATCMSNG